MTADHSVKKSWRARLEDFLMREPTDKTQLLALLRSASEKHILDPEALSMIEGVLQVSNMRVRDIMIPKAKMVSIDHDMTLETSLPIIVESGHSRFPVLSENKNDVLGILLAKDLLIYLQDRTKVFNPRKLTRPTIYIPESKRLDALLREFRLNHNHMALVVDEYGGISGLVTIEDVLELIVGEIEDESDREEDEGHIKDLGDHVYTVKALTPIDEFNRYFKTDFNDDEFDTIGGFVTQSFGHLAKRNEVTTLGKYQFEVLHADNRRIRLLKVTLKS